MPSFSLQSSTLTSSGCGIFSIHKTFLPADACFGPVVDRFSITYPFCQRHFLGVETRWNRRGGVRGGRRWLRRLLWWLCLTCRRRRCLIREWQAHLHFGHRLLLGSFQRTGRWRRGDLRAWGCRQGRRRRGTSTSGFGGRSRYCCCSCCCCYCRRRKRFANWNTKNSSLTRTMCWYAEREILKMRYIIL